MSPLRNRLASTLFVLLGGASAPGFPAAPLNDAFADRVELAGSAGQVQGSNVGATRESGEPMHAGLEGGRSAWWTWTAPAEGTAAFTTAGSAPDTLLAVYTGDSTDELRSVSSNDDLSDDVFQSTVRFTAREGTSYSLAIDGLGGESGNLLLAWHLGPAQGAPLNDAFAAREALNGASGRLVATNRNATREPGEPRHAEEEGGASLWWSWTAPASGVATFSTRGSGLDTLLALYEGQSLAALRVLASSDDATDDLTSYVDVDVVEGKSYCLAADGFAGRTGVVVLVWTLYPPCSGPDAPTGPLPPPDAAGVSTEPVLQWGVPNLLRRKVIYGDDDRLEIYEVADPAVREAARSTAILVSAPLDLTDNLDGTYTLPGATFAEFYGLCPDEPFADQPGPGRCTAFLVAPDIVATAGHCILIITTCPDAAFVFGFYLTKRGDVPLRVDASQVYRCAELIGSHQASPEELEDWALVRLDRPVPDHVPLRVRRSGKVANAQPLLLVGNPGGIPTKVAAGAAVRDNSGSTFFFANLDSYSGNSGSPVLNAETLMVEGILVAGEADFVEDGPCRRSHRCANDGCTGEAVARATNFDYLIPATLDPTYRVYFGPCGGLKLAGTTTEPRFSPGPLASRSEYCWKVVAENDCGAVEGPVWSFNTGDGAASRFARGDAVADGRLNLTDPVSILNHLFLGDEAPTCAKAADTNDSGRLDITDAVYLLRFLFLGGSPPQPPFGACGVDLTADDLSCESYGVCP